MLRESDGWTSTISWGKIGSLFLNSPFGSKLLAMAGSHFCTLIFILENDEVLETFIKLGFTQVYSPLQLSLVPRMAVSSFKSFK